jgi:hypothetical protein
LNWIKENIKLFLSIFGTVTTIGGFVIGVYVTTMTLKTKVENTETDIKEIKVSVSEQKNLNEKILWFLMNRKEEKIIRAKGIE